MKKALERTRGVFAFLAVIVVLILMAYLFFFSRSTVGTTGIERAVRISSIFMTGYLILLIIDLISVVPLAVLKRTRGVAGVGMIIFSYLFGLILWVWCFLLTYFLWGRVAALVGLLLAGVGVLPFAMLASVFQGLWATLLNLIVLTIATLVFRFWGFRLVELHEGSNGRPPYEGKPLIAERTGR